MCETYSKLTMRRPERRRWLRSDVFIVNFEHITPLSSVSIVNFEYVIAGWYIFFINFRLVACFLFLANKA